MLPWLFKTGYHNLNQISGYFFYVYCVVCTGTIECTSCAAGTYAAVKGEMPIQTAILHITTLFTSLLSFTLIFPQGASMLQLEVHYMYIFGVIPLCRSVALFFIHSQLK
jgi:hypothetical protein